MRVGSIVAAVFLFGLFGCARREISTTNTRSASMTASDIAWRPRIEIARGEAVRGPWIQNDSEYRWVDDPSVQLASDGDAIVAWVDQTKKDILIARWSRDGSRRFDPVNVSMSPSTFSWFPRVAANGDDVHVLWQEIVFSGGSHGGEIFFATSQDGGRTYSAPVNLSNSQAGDGKGRLEEKIWDNGSLDFARGSRGELYAAWTEYEGALWLRRSDDRGKSFARAVRIAGTRERPARGPSIAVAPDGDVHVAWAVGEDAHARIERAVSKDRGATFGSPALFGSGESRCDAPSTAVDPVGRSHLVFVDGGRIAYVRGNASTRWLSGDGARIARIAIDGVHVFVLYEREGVPRERSQSLVLAHSSDGGETFGEAPVLGIAGPSLGWNASQQGMFLEKIAVAPNGVEIAVVNGTFLEKRESHIWLLRGSLR